MTTVELAEYVLNHDMDEVIAKCEEIIENDFNNDDCEEEEQCYLKEKHTVNLLTVQDKTIGLKF